MAVQQPRVTGATGRRDRRTPPTTDGARLARSTVRRTARGQRTRQQIIDSARTVFERDGFLHARISDICHEAGVSHGSFYTYFVSKEEVFKEVTDAIELTLLESEGPAPPDASPIERIEIANRHYLEVFKKNAGIIAVIQQVSTFDSNVLATRIERQQAFARVIMRRVDKLQQDGLADPRIDSWYAANALGSMVASFAEHMFIQRLSEDLEKAVEQLTILWANALGLPSS